MHRKLTREEVEAVCRRLLSERRRVTVRSVMAELRRCYRAAGRTERVSMILRQLAESAGPTPPEGTELASLREQLRVAEERAARAEELERQHQDFWANRYAEKVTELERRYAEALNTKQAIRSEQYLRIHQRAAELAQRLARYEPVEPLISPPPSQSG